MDDLNIDGPSILPSAIAPPPTNGGLPPVLTNPLNLPPAGPPQNLPGGLAPQVTHPPTRLESDQAKLQGLQDNGSGVQQFQGRHPVIGGIIHGLDIAGSILAPRIATAIPGTTLNHQQQLGQAQGVVAGDEDQAQKAAQLEDTQGQTQQRKALGDKAQAQAEEYAPQVVSAEQAQQMGMPQLAGTSISGRDLARLSGTVSTNQTRVTTTGMNNQTSRDNAQAKADLAAQKPQQRDDHYLSIMEKAPAERTPEDNAFVSAYHNWVDTTKTQPGVARAVAFSNSKPVVVVDPSNPENAVYTNAGTAMKTGASSTQSQPYQVSKKLNVAFTSGEPAKNINTLNTSYGHLGQLNQLAGALDNGDLQGFNRMGNAYATATGAPAPTNFNAVRDAVAGEISKTFKGGGATDAEIKEINDTISNAQSPAQLSGVIHTYQGLLQSKKDALQQQYTQGKQGKPNFNGGQSGEETRTYQGHTYVKGPQGWHLQQ